LWCAALCAQTRIGVIITGTFKTPDGKLFNGYLTVSAQTQPGLSTCSHKAYGGPARIKIVNGVLGTLTLDSSSCITPTNATALTKNYYVATVYNAQNKLMYRAYWEVPFTLTTYDVSAIDVAE
jgi:hypothetical protein